MQTKRIISSILFFIIGVSVFWLVYRKFNFSELISSLKNVKFGWIVVSISFGLLSHLIRAIRWKMLIEPLGYKPSTSNLFLSVIILYFTNLIIPRGGELTRCTIISKYEQVPFAKLAGTVLVERITDLLAFLLILLILVLWQVNFFRTVAGYPGFQLDFSNFHVKIITIIIIGLVTGILLLLMARFKVFSRIKSKVLHIKDEFMEGILVLRQLEKKAKYLTYTFLIFFLWLLMLYSVFFAYPPTNKLPFMVAVLTYTFGTLAYLLPIQAGMGTWHFIVINCLFFFGVDKENGMIFALIAHTFTNLIFLILGPIALAILPFTNRTAEQVKLNSAGISGKITE